MSVLGSSDQALGSSIAGRVTTAHGTPVAGAVVMITGDSPPHHDIGALTNDRGEYALDELPPGEYTILVNPEDGLPQRRQVQVDTNEVARLDFSLSG